MSVVGLGITTFERPDQLERCLASVEEHLKSYYDDGKPVGPVVIYEDASAPEFKARYDEILNHYAGRNYKIIRGTTNMGVGHAKNECLKYLYELGCDYFFLLEDDQIIKSPKAITEYIRISELTGIEHFAFAHHGPINEAGHLGIQNDGLVEVFAGSVGAYTFYTRNVIDTVGYHDPFYKNAYEHVDYTARIAAAGLTTPFWRFADITGSQEYLEEQPDALTTGRIRQDPNWIHHVHEARKYCEQKNAAVWFPDLEGVPVDDPS